MEIREILLAMFGICCGFAVAGAVFALIVTLRLIPRLAARTRTAKNILFYEDCVLFGGVLGNLAFLFNWPLPFGNVGVCIYGAFTGMFVGCIAVALEEILNVFPVLIRRTKLKKGVHMLTLFMALGKAAGSFLFFFNHWFQ